MNNNRWLIISFIAAALLLTGAFFTHNYSVKRLALADSTGQNAGTQKGYSDGYNAGGQAGFASGNTTGYDTGEPKGYQTGLDTGYAAGKTAGYKAGEQAGYTAGHAQGFATGNATGFPAGESQGYTALYQPSVLKAVGSAMYYNPTYDYAMQLLQQCGKYTASGIISYMDKQKVRSGYVWMKMQNGNGLGYELMAFDTIDKGIIYILPGSHREVQPKVGEHLSQITGISSGGIDDIISTVTIVW